MRRKFPELFRPLEVAGVRLKNRIFSAPMAYPDITPEGYLTPEAAAFYELRARGGAAIVTVSECVVHSETGRSHNINISMDAPNALPGLAMTASAIKRHGAVACAELNHSGKYSGADNLDKSRNKENLRFGPSADVLENGSVIREMPREMIHMLVGAYGKSAALAKKAGFEMIMLHAGHGWLLHQFFSPEHNRRGDEYGGSTENRARLIIEVIDAVRAAVGPGFPIDVRISADEYSEAGYGPDDALKLALLIEDRIDMLHVSTGNHESCFDKTHLPMFSPRGGNVHYATEIKRHIKKIPVTAIGALSDPEMMNDILASGRADALAMARQLLADPFWPIKVMTGKEEEIVRCCRCFTCMAERMATGQRICSLNPVIGHEYEAKFAPPPAVPKKVLIAGGGPGGMQAAVTAAQRGHRVILCEKSSELGGALRAERGIPFKRDLFHFVAVKALEMKNAGVEVRLNTEVTPELVGSEAPDALLVAVGALPLVPPIPGIDGGSVVMANDLSEPDTEIGRRVVILGGGLVGCESAVHLAQAGHEVTVIEMLPEVAADANGRHRPILLDLLSGLAAIKTGLRGTRITADGLYCEDLSGGEHFFPADTIVCAAGQHPLRGVLDSLSGCAPIVEAIGDCVRPQNVTQAVYRGYHAALDI